MGGGSPAASPATRVLLYVLALLKALEVLLISIDFMELTMAILLVKHPTLLWVSMAESNSLDKTKLPPVKADALVQACIYGVGKWRLRGWPHSRGIYQSGIHFDAGQLYGLWRGNRFFGALIPG